jgi:periplasmic protein CpxP/Spy
MRITMKLLRTSLFAAALLSSVAAVGLAPAFAQTAAAPASPAASEHPAEHMMRGILPGQLVDGRIAFLRAELKITPSQKADWEKVAAAMRQNADALDRAITSARDHPGNANALDRLEMREEFAKLRAANSERLLTAFKPLYAGLSPEQQQMANRLLMMEHHWHHGWHAHA